ncbi:MULTISPECIES: malate dehydrogenase (quinone) [unclassified Neptuniibacter]|uniref:malate dehydrogenase (quinone) n=1 Tax=unclassified Neptuniibacter TaxID=2630693 RepID=UPI000C5BFD5F|nr:MULTISPECIES: malate dehydrogenase (quinone) [unclassified Neptuniibacter]MAY41302.1 malate dehydrogenase (quinone) [Oceanospirillaceae bacterium]|tara:strand:+ start:1302 stop:2789 length:1488 start_codon:yes stop_codon:yes gene_type:complete
MTTKSVDVLLVGAGAMSSTLGVLLKQLDPSLKICMAERLDQVAMESTDCMNNAGTGHAAYCELNYTPEMADGSINCDKAYAINASFEVSLQFWSYLVQQNALPEPSNFINPVPHQSFVWGDKNVEFLRKRYEALSSHHQFDIMEYSEDPDVLRQWMPLVMENRKDGEKIAATRVRYGSDVNFGSLARSMVKNLQDQNDFDLLLNHDVVDFYQNKDKSWSVTLKNKESKQTEVINSRFVFLGAGGGALPLLQKSGIAEGDGYGGFPVSGQWLVCNNQEIVEQHEAKVYGAAPIGAPPMSVPHLDTRVIDGKKALLFGPFAGFTTKFLKKGSMLDMFGSLKLNNLKPMLYVGATSMDLTRYLISEVMQTHGSRVMSLSNFIPEAKEHDWEISHAGQRVQIIKKDANGKGKLEFGTEVITSADGSLAALLGASPGASTAVSAMLSIVERCFADELATEAWQDKIKTMIPSYGQDLTQDVELLRSIRQQTLSTLQLDPQ